MKRTSHLKKAELSHLQPNAAPDTASDLPVAAVAASPDHAGYQRDLWERSVLFLDTLRKRAENMIDHERAGMPPLLDFKYETLLDARRFDIPANYALLRITEIEGHCWDDCVDHAKPPVIVVDPRAGHGPGIGGFKQDSEVGMAMTAIRACHQFFMATARRVGR
jgi:hypothetical protein